MTRHSTSAAPHAPSRTSSPNTSGDVAADARSQALRDLLARVRRIELSTRGKVNASATGAWQARFRGRGMTYAESLPYARGDDPRHIDWNASARTGELFVKHFTEERELTVLLAVDMSGSMHTGTRGRDKRTLATEAAALLALSALRTGDKVGLCMFDERGAHLVRPKKGRGHVLRILRDVLGHTPDAVGTDLAEAFRTVTRLSTKRAIVALISDFQPGVRQPGVRQPGVRQPGVRQPGVRQPGVRQSDEAMWDAARKPLAVLARRHDVLALDLSDPAEHTLPAVGLLRVVDPESGQVQLVDTSDARVRAAYETARAAAAERRVAALRQAGVDYAPLGTTADAQRALLRFLERRKGARAA